ncbi:putative signal peptide-containing lipoprotein [Bacillus phage Izhevsk]|uniref:Putative signal peptide-containing lipoprotein n=1 Tax=Bacillus phage Izhevsk TaxID=2724322 RepID=A0A6H0X5Y7_9CAUD|nr:putative signal peptide-containing lipoprotein [Bacillus phage Izhevsk]QIW89703.1 putative signal peptide-containing lipoprotein [Bacillus phage Izhevsk]
MWLKIFGAMWIMQGCWDAWKGYKKCDSDYILLTILAFLAGLVLICASYSE